MGDTRKGGLAATQLHYESSRQQQGNEAKQRRGGNRWDCWRKRCLRVGKLLCLKRGQVGEIEREDVEVVRVRRQEIVVVGNHQRQTAIGQLWPKRETFDFFGKGRTAQAETW